MRQAYVIMTNTLCNGDIIGSWSQEGDGPDLPTLFDTEEAGWKDIADDMVTELKQFIDGERDYEDTSFGTDDWVELVTVLEDGTIMQMFGGQPTTVLFDPKIGRQ